MEKNKKEGEAGEEVLTYRHNTDQPDCKPYILHDVTVGEEGTMSALSQIEFSVNKLI